MGLTHHRRIEIEQREKGKQEAERKREGERGREGEKLVVVSRLSIPLSLRRSLPLSLYSVLHL
jgi:hypothetical protein